MDIVDPRVIEALERYKAEPVLFEIEGHFVDLIDNTGIILEAISNAERNRYRERERDRLITGRRLDDAESLLSGEVLLGQFPAAAIGEPDWTEDPFEDRNWQWRWHQWEFALDLLHAWNQDGETKWLYHLLDWIDSWIDSNLDNPPRKEMAWHDHVTALRLRNMLLTWEACIDAGILDEVRGASLLRAMTYHARLLCEEWFFMRHTNHGYDQMMVLYEFSVAIPELSESQSCRTLALERLVAEIEFCFTKDGVHIENSPGYHQMMLTRLIRFPTTLAAYGEVMKDGEYDEIIERGMDFLAWITRPDGKLPTIGDTGSVQLDRLLANAPTEIESLPLLFVSSDGEEGEGPESMFRIFPESGWAIFRDGWSRGDELTQALHLVLKSGFLSIFHRQDDDLHITLFAYGSEWLLDGGLFNHNENDPRRIHLRSPRAHNIPVLEGIQPHRDPARGRAETGLVALDGNRSGVIAHTGMYPGFRVERTLEMTGVRSLRIVDTIELVNEKAVAGLEGIHVRFHLPQSLQFELDDDSVRALRDDGRVLTIRAVRGCNGVTQRTGIYDDVIESWVSPSYGVGHDAVVICFHMPVDGEEIEFDLTFDEVGREGDVA